MKKLFLWLVLSCFINMAMAQVKNDFSISMQGGNFTPPENVQEFSWVNFKSTFTKYSGRYFATIQLYKIPLKNDWQAFQSAGITILDYIAPGTYNISFQKQLSKSLLQDLHVRGIFTLPPQYKIATTLLQENLPTWSIKKPGTVDVFVSIANTVSLQEAINNLTAENFEIIYTDWQAYHVLQVRIPASKIKQLAQLPFIQYIQPIAPADKKLNDELTHNARSNVLNAPITKGGENLRGQGVAIGVGDDANITSHIDLVDRVINRSPFVFQNHGTQTSGNAAGGGIKDPLYKGVAPMATIISQVFSGIIVNAAKYVLDYGMVVTNNSYGATTRDCEYAGTYDLYSRMLDQQAFQLPELLHVFAAGNDGPFNLTCPGFVNGYHSLVGGYQAGKNVLDVAWGDKIPQTSTGSSIGPAADGRIKPEIVATGSEVRSTAINNGYVTDWGSSLASPAVAGGAALLIEKYRQMHGGANPKSGLVKALLMNGATDIENPGPDFKSGYGWLNLNRSLDMIKTQRHLTAGISQGTVNNHVITIPAGVSRAKIMLYWHDPAAAVFAKHTLVNNLDIEVITPSASTILPWVLDTTNGNLNNPALRGVDNINNTEQITFDNPAAGTYTIRIKGTAINMNPTQEYFIVYDLLQPVVDLTFPSVGEPLVPGETVQIVWDAWDYSPNNFTLQFSANNGATWSDINTNIPATQHYLSWVVPAVNTDVAKVRLLRNGTALQDESIPFTIVAQPNVSLSTVQCEGYFSFQWNAITGATDYEVMMKQGPEMVPVAITNSTSYLLSGLNKDSTYWVTVRPRINGQPGRRAVAINRKPNAGTCAGSISDNDLKMDSILSPHTGRKFTSTEITTNNLSVRIKNLDDAAVTNFDVKYSINGSAFISQNVNATIPALGTYVHTFTGINFSATGSYNIIAVVTNSTTDVVTTNDTLQRIIQHLPNAPVTLNVVENFETAPAFEITGNYTGLPGLPRWDLKTTTPLGRARSFVNTGIALNGNRAITLDVTQYIAAGNTNYLIGTYNLANYNAQTQDEVGITLDFWFKHHGQFPSPQNRVWMRNTDTAQWIEIYNLDENQTQFPGEWKKAGPIHLDKILETQRPSSSFQIRFGQDGVIGMADDHGFEGITLDSIRLFSSNQDHAVIAIDTPVINSCGLSANVPLRIKVAKYRQIAANATLSYKLDGGPTISESVLLPTDTSLFTFTQPLNLSSPGDHTLDVWISFAGDNDKSNDSIINYIIKNQPVISAFPYFENFENGAGNWYAKGHNSSWQYGTPASNKITKAASGSKAWKTALIGTYNDEELSYLYSPCFNISTMTNPYLSFGVAMDLEQCTHSVCDRAWVEYSTNGKEWNKLGAYGQGTNWYNRAGDNVWDTANFRRWHTASIPLPTGFANMQFRFVMQSDGSLIKEGIAIDDIHIYDLQYPVFTTTPSSNTITQNVSGSGFQYFTEGGKVFAAINPGGNNLGSTSAQTFIHGGGPANVRDTNQQYYHNRNFTIQPTNTVLPDSSIVRLYFTDSETDLLVRATGCNTCSKPLDAWQLGITKYDDIDKARENSTLADNTSGTYSFIPPWKVKIVPYDNGYYAEYKVKNFSEFWLNSGGTFNNQPLPLQLVHFTATKQNSDVVLHWNTTNEINVDHFEIEVAKTSADLATQRFVNIGLVKANNRLQNKYAFTDREENKKGIRYYRLKMTDKNGAVTYSEVRKIVFDASVDWQVFPNPVRNVLQLVVSGEPNSQTEVTFLNSVGQVIFTNNYSLAGGLEKISIPLSAYSLQPGVYVVKIVNGETVKWSKIVKE